MRLALYALISAFCVGPVWGQIAQSHPEYCGIPGGASPPLLDISATIDSGGHAVLYIGRGKPTEGIPLEGSLLAQIAEVCPLSDGRLVVFADIGGAIATYIVDRAKASVLDYFWAYAPLMSPDQRRIVYDKFYALHGVEGSSEYLIYDLAKGPAQNRPDGDAKNFVDVGAVIFPPGQKNLDNDNTDVPRDQLHGRGSGFHWAADSRAVLFVDGVPDNPKKIVLVTLDEKGTPSALEHQITVGDLCGREIPGVNSGMWTMDRAEVGPDLGGTRAIVLDLHSDDRRCPTRVVQLYKSDFQPAKTEVHIREEPARGVVIKDGSPPVPPKKK
jgi:hypothetical protein